MGQHKIESYCWLFNQVAMQLFLYSIFSCFFGVFIGYSVCYVQQAVKKHDKKKRRLTEMSSFSEEGDKEPDELWNKYDDYEKSKDNT